MSKEEQTLELMKQQLEIAERLLAAKARGEEVDEKQLATSASYVRSLQSIREHNEAVLESLESQRDRLAENDTRGRASFERQIAQQKRLNKLADENGTKVDKLIGQMERQGVVQKQVMDNVFSEGTRLQEVSSKMTEQQIDSVGDLAGATAGAINGAVQSIGGALMATFKDPRLAAIMAMPNLGTTLENYRQNLEALPGELDESVRGLVKDTALDVQSLGQNLIFAMDPLYAQRMGVAFDEANKPLHSIGLTAGDTQGAISDLLANTAFFRPAFMDANKGASAFITNLVGGLNKIGIGTGTSTKLLNTFTKALQKSPIEAGKSLKKIANIADSLGMSAGEVASNFENMSGNLAQYGSNMIDVMGDLQAQAIATGTSVGALASFAEGLDTFDGAADAAQRLNAVLGGTFVSVTDLVDAEPADKIAMIQDAIGAAGIDFENADRRMKQVITSAAGFGSVEEAMKVLSNADAAEEAAGALNKQVMTQEELEQKINNSMTITEQMNKGLSNMAGGMQQILDTVRPGAVKFANVVNSAFGTMLDKTENSAAAAITLQGTLGAMGAAGNIAAAGIEAAGGALGDLFTILAANPRGLAALGIVGGLVGLGTLGAAGLGAYDEGGGLPEVFPENKGEQGQVFGPQKTDLGGASPISTLVTQISENTTSIKDLTAALNEKSDVPVNLSVQSVMDGETVGEGQAQAIINILTGKAMPAP